MADDSDFEPEPVPDDESEFEYAGSVSSEDVGEVYDEDEDFAPPKKKARKSKAKTKAKAKPKAKAKSKAKGKGKASKDKASKGGEEESKGEDVTASQSSSSSKNKSKKKAAKPKATKKGGAGGAGAGSAKKAAKPKGKTYTEKQAPAVLLEYLNTQNKPYSAINVFDNLHKAVKRAHVNRVLDKLADSGQIKRKQYKKFKLYYPDQAQFGEITPQSVAKHEADLKEVSSALKVASANRAALEKEVNDLKTALTDEALAKRLDEINAALEAKRAKLAELEAAGRTISPAAKDTHIANFKKYRKVWAARRHKVMDIVERMSEGMEKKPKVVMNMLELETDTEYGVSLKECKM